MITEILMGIVSLLAATKPAAPLQIFNRERQVIVTVTTAVSGSDLQFTANFPRPVKSYLKEEYDNLPLEFHVESDNNKRTGNQDSPDARLGAKYIVVAVARMPRAGAKAEEVPETQNSNNETQKTAAKIRVDGSRMIVSVPLS